MPKLTLLFKGQSLSVHHLKEGRTLIGREPGCDIVIDSLAVAPHHVQLETKGDQCRLRRMDETNPVFVNKASVEEIALKHGDMLRVGKHSLRFAVDGYVVGAKAESKKEKAPKDALAEDSQGVTAAGTGYLQILSGENIGRIIPLNRNMIRLGKAGGDCAIIVHRSGGYYLSHLEGGIPAVDNVPVGDQSVLLSVGSTVRIGDTELQFYI